MMSPMMSMMLTVELMEMTIIIFSSLNTLNMCGTLVPLTAGPGEACEVETPGKKRVVKVRFWTEEMKIDLLPGPQSYNQ